MDKKLKKILIINTGGTFNKVYDPLKGTLEIDQEGQALDQLTSRWLCEFKILNIIGKDSLQMTNEDRLELLGMIHQSEFHDIIVIHGTDTMDVTAEYLADAELEKSIILTGAMVPYSIDPVEATANFASAYGYLNATQKRGVFIAMHGLIAPYDTIIKDRKKGTFILS
jgi:L-asparaginase